MATWQQRGVTSPVQAWDPDFSFLTQAYSINQARYDKGFNQVKSVYNSLLNGPLTNESNKAYRNEIFKRLEETLKSTSSMDFSKAENVQKAISMLEPLTKDEDFAYDLAVTKYHQGEKAKMESYKNSDDPEKRKLYSDYAAQAIAMAESDLAAAKRGDGSIKKVRPQEFVMFEDIDEYLSEAAKADGLIIKSVSHNGGYILEDTNGKQAIMPFAAWAQQKMGNKFDRQLNLQSKVMAETAIRGTMQQQGLSRQDAIMAVAQKKLPAYAQGELTTVQSLTKDLNRIESEIKILEDEYGTNGLPTNMGHLKEHYSRLVQQRDIHKNLISNSANTLKRINSEEAGYIANNIYNVYGNDVKMEKTLGWATTRAMATAERDKKADQTWITKYNNQIKMAIHQDNMYYKAANLKLDQGRFNLDREKLKLDWYKAMNDGKSGTGGSGGSGAGGADNLITITGEDALSSYVGNVTSDQTKQAVDILGQKIRGNYDNLFKAIVKADSGMLQLVVPKSEFNGASETMHKLKLIADGQVNTKLTDEDKNYLVKYGNRIGYTFDPEQVVGNSKSARQMIQAIGLGTYSLAQEKLQQYTQSGTLPKHIKNVNQFANAFNSMQNIMQDEEAINNALRNISTVIAEAEGDTFKGAEIIGYNPDSTPIYDLSKISDEAKNLLQPFISKEFEKLKAPVGQMWNYSGITPGEMEAIMNSNMSDIYDENGEKVDHAEVFGQLKDAPDNVLAEFFGDRIDASYDPVKEMVTLSVKVDPTSALAKSQKIKTPTTYRIQMPYSSIRSNAQSLPRFNKGMQNNSMDTEGAGAFSAFLTNPYARLKSNSYYDAAGFEYDIAGIDYEDEYGTDMYGLNVVTRVFDPVKNKYIENVTRIPIMNPGNPTSYNKVNDAISAEFTKYMLSLGKLKGLEKELEKIPLKDQ